MKSAILVFPGTNCEQDLKKVLSKYYRSQIDLIWHTDTFEDQYDFYFLPGGFSYGDYLRSGALAKMSNTMQCLKRVNKKGKKILGICNGFQILTEAHLLPGALVRNRSLKHICRWVDLKSAYPTWSLPPKFSLPVSHSEGNYICSQDTLKELKANGQILMQYRENVNGSVESIAGICNPKKNIFGLMPHPERAFEKILDIPKSSEQYGKLFFDQFFQ